MKSIEEVFVLHRAKSGAFVDYEPGDVAFLTNGFTDNGLVGYVTPKAKDRVFTFPALVVSAFCEATVQLPPFLAYGAAGTSLVVLEPRSPMTAGQLAYIAAYINQVHRWRFNWYRRSIPTRLQNLQIPDNPPRDISYAVTELIPTTTTSVERPDWVPDYKPFPLDAIFTMTSGDHHSLSELTPGATPVVSCGNEENGIAGYYDVPPRFSHVLTIALNGATLTAKYHPYAFAAKDDVAVCRPKSKLRLSTLLFVQVMLNRERWRYSYYRKCYMNKLPRFSLLLPEKNGGLDEAMIEALVTTSPYWDFLKSRITEKMP